MSRISLIALALAVTSGCATDAADETDTGSVESAITVLPLAGTWTYGELSPISTNCSTSAVHGESGPFTVDSVTASTFRIVPNDGTAPFTCNSLANSAFGCPKRASLFVDFRPFIDAQLTVLVTVSGVFSDSSHALGKQDAAVSCVGSNCSLFGTMPCGFVDDFSAHM